MPTTIGIVSTRTFQLLLLLTLTEVLSDFSILHRVNRRCSPLARVMIAAPRQLRRWIPRGQAIVCSHRRKSWTTRTARTASPSLSTPRAWAPVSASVSASVSATVPATVSASVAASVSASVSASTAPPVVPPITASVAPLVAPSVTPPTTILWGRRAVALPRTRRWDASHHARVLAVTVKW